VITGFDTLALPGVLARLAALPDAEEARRLAEQELSKSEYLAAQPNAFDRASLAVLEFLDKLLNPDLGNGAGGLVLLIAIAAVVIALLVIGVIAWGRPRASRRMQSHGALLGQHDQLSAAQLRAAADDLARAGDWGGAVTQRYRALARSLIERELLDPAPGATAQSIAAAASRSFPDEQAALLNAAQLFDGVRYLGAPGDEPTYQAVRAVDERISLARIAVPA
jgi:hypothetical protein